MNSIFLFDHQIKSPMTNGKVAKGRSQSKRGGKSFSSVNVQVGASNQNDSCHCFCGVYETLVPLHIILF